MAEDPEQYSNFIIGAFFVLSLQNSYNNILHQTRKPTLLNAIQAIASFCQVITCFGYFLQRFPMYYKCGIYEEFTHGFYYVFKTGSTFVLAVRCTALLSEQNKLLAKVSIFILFAIALGFNIFARVIYTGVTGLCEVNSDLGMDVVSKIAFIFMYLLLLFSILVPIVQTINGSGVSNDTAAIIRNVSQRLITAIGVTLIMIVLLLIFPDHYVRIMHVIQNYTIIRASSHPNASNSNSWSNAARSSRSNRQDI